MTHRIIPRSEWGARRGDGVGHAQVPATECYLHHSVTVAPDTVQPFDDDYEAIRTIEQVGVGLFGERYGFPYTAGVTPAGLVFAGHDPAKMGAHTYRHNDTARAIVLVGNYMTVRPTDAQIESVAWLLRHWHEQGILAAPQLTGGHRDVYATACPGDMAVPVIPVINELARTGGSLTPVEPEEEDEDMAYLVWNSEKTTSPLLLVGGNVAIIVDHDSVESWKAAGAKRVAQTNRDFEAIKSRMS